jgi:hypothetical protein
MIMCANGVPERLILDLFDEAVVNIKGLKERVERSSITKEDWNLMSTCSEVKHQLAGRCEMTTCLTTTTDADSFHFVH